MFPDVAADGSAAELETGEIVLLPTALWLAIDEAIAVAGTIADADQARTAFAGAFAKGLVKHQLIVVAEGDPKSTRTVSLATYSLALDGKHAAEGKIGAVRQMVNGWSPDGIGALSLLDEMAQGVLANAGRAPPDDRPRLQNGFLRIRALAAILAGKPTEGWDLAQAPPLPEQLAALFKGEIA